mmetsp:Transcript_85792/g.179253  ORF Transcript_85792/g.179253 Transcript_85792/m.179253 type:complete len:97 (+) Transcript_85792:41-331(+)
MRCRNSRRQREAGKSQMLVKKEEAGGELRTFPIPFCVPSPSLRSLTISTCLSTSNVSTRKDTGRKSQPQFTLRALASDDGWWDSVGKRRWYTMQLF